MVAREHHKDLGLHLHIALWFTDIIRFTSKNFWDFVGGKHGNYQLMSRPEGWVKYILKEDDFVATEGFDPKSFIKAKKRKQSTSTIRIESAILGGEYHIEELEKLAPGYMLANLKKVEYYSSHVQQRVEARFTPMPMTQIEPHYANLNIYEQEIYDWLFRYSQRKTLNNGCYGDTHLRVHGHTGIGKTSLLIELHKFFRCYQVPFDGRWYDDFLDEDYDLLTFEEYGKSNVKTPQQLNALTDGMGVKLCRRGIKPTVHKRQLPCIMMTNFSWEECYPIVGTSEPVYLEATMRRFHTVQIPKSPNVALIPAPTLFNLINLLKAHVHVEEDESSESEKRQRE